MLQCEECECVAGDATGWVAYYVEDPEQVEQPEVAAYCPPCAHRHFERPMAYRIYL